MKDPEFYTRLEEKLNEEHSWPSLYMFKFIVPSDNQRIAQVQALFGPEAQVDLRQSSKGKYTSITGKEVMLSTAKVIQRYKDAAEIEGLISM